MFFSSVQSSKKLSEPLKNINLTKRTNSLFFLHFIVLLILTSITITLKTKILFAAPIQITRTLSWSEEVKCIIQNNNAITTFTTCYVGLEEKIYLVYYRNLITAANFNAPPDFIKEYKLYFYRGAPTIKVEPINTNYKCVKDSINLFGFNYLFLPYSMNKERLLFLSLQERDYSVNYGLYFEKDSRETFLESRKHNCLTNIGFDGKLSDVSTIGINYNIKRNVININRGKEDIKSNVASIYGALKFSDNIILCGDFRKGYIHCHAPSITNEYGIALEEEINTKNRLFGTSFTANYFYPIKETLLVPSISFTYDTIPFKSFKNKEIDLLRRLTFKPSFLLKATSLESLELIFTVDKEYYINDKNNISKKSFYNIGAIMNSYSAKNIFSIYLDLRSEISKKRIAISDFFVNLSISL